MGVMRSLSFCYMHYIVTINIDSCRFFSLFFFFFFFVIYIYIYIVCVWSLPRICTCHFSEMEKKKICG